MTARKIFVGAGVLAIALTLAAGTAFAAPQHRDRVVRVGHREVMGARDGKHEKRAPNHQPHNAKTDKLRDRGGLILPSPRVYAIWWGDPNGGLTDFLTGLGSSPYLQTAREYMRGAALSTTFVQNLTDTSAPISGDPGERDIGNEVARVLAANNLQPDATGIYLVFTSNFPTRGNYCAWHGAASVNGVEIAIAYMPNVDNITGCSVGDVNAYTRGTQALANVTAHEVIEAITDPIPYTGWLDHREEIADKCAWKWDGTVRIGSTNWRVQKEWSNAANACVQL